MTDALIVGTDGPVAHTPFIVEGTVVCNLQPESRSWTEVDATEGHIKVLQDALVKTANSV
jgi:hypothetical protein